MSNGGTVNTFSDTPMAVENEPYIPVQVKYVEAYTATVKHNSRNPNVPTLQITEPEQVQEFQSIVEQSQPNLGGHGDLYTHSPVASPASESPTNSMPPNKFQYDPNLSYAEKVAYEMIMTEKLYLENLKQIIDGFLDPVSNNPDLDVSQENIDDLFINVEEIYNFNWVLLKDMEQCDYDPVKLAKCFVVKQIGFDVYTKYCTHYPRSMEVLLEWTQREDTANFIKNQQESLGHTLPLCSFLLKPVQRILKYHLLLGNIAKHYKQSEDEEGYEIIQKALATMTNVAKHINNMKRIHEDAVHLQEIQSVLVEYEGPNLTSYGSLVLESNFRLHGTKTGRYLFLFEKALLITKRRSDGTFTWKGTVMYSNMMLADSVFREPLTFQVIPFDDRKICYTFVARDMDTKRVWLLELKRRLLDSYAAVVPQKAKQIILGNSEKENTEPDNDKKSVRTYTSKNVNHHRTMPSKESDNDRSPIATSTPEKGSNQQRTVLSKDNTVPSTKSLKVTETENRKSKDSEDMLEDKVAALMASIRSPLRRKLRVFKKRKFSKDQGKHPKRVSWSSDDNAENDLLSPNEDCEEEELKSENTDDDTTPTKNDVPAVKDIIDEEIMGDTKDEDIVSMESPRSTSPAEHEHDSVLAENTIEEDTKTVPIKKRKTKQDREKSRTLPAGVLLARTNERLKQIRSHSLTELDEKFPAKMASPDKEPQETLVHLRENAAVIRTRRGGSIDEQMSRRGEKNEEEMSPLEGFLRRNPGVDNLTDENTSTIADESAMSHTMRCVSAAFSDASTGFSRGDTPASSTEELTEDFTGQEDDSDDLGTFSEQQDTYWDKESETFDERSDKNLDVSEHFEEVVSSPTIWDRIEVTDERYNNSLSNDEEMSVLDVQSIDDGTSTLLSERSSYADTLSDSFDDQDEPMSPSKHFDGTYQKVFALKRSFSEENITTTKCVCDDEAGIKPRPVSENCHRFDHKHAVVSRSKSVDNSSTQSRSNSNYPFIFSVTPKKKIIIKDSLWETIKEDSEVGSVDTASLRNSERSARRRRKRRNHRSRKSTTEEEPKETVHRPVLRSCTSLDIADFRKEKLESEKKLDDDVESRGTGADDDDIATTSSQSISSADTSVTAQESEPVTDVKVALKSRQYTKEDLVRVDGNVSRVPSSINYLCIEKLPSDEPENKDGSSVAEHSKCNGISKVGRLSKYFNETKAGNNKSKSESTDKKQRVHVSNIKQRVEELKRKEWSAEEKGSVKGELTLLGNLKDRIDVLKKTASEENQKSKIERRTTFKLVAPNVKHIKNRIEEIASTESLSTEGGSQVDEGLRNQFQDTLHIKEHISGLENNKDQVTKRSSITRDRNLSEKSRGWDKLKDRIEKLHNEKKQREMESERDITVSDESVGLTSPRQNEELKTLVIKRGWVQQFIQKIETVNTST